MLITNWKKALKMYSVQMALIYTGLQWVLTATESGWPDDLNGWVNCMVGLAFAALRIVAQPALEEGESK